MIFASKFKFFFDQNLDFVLGSASAPFGAVRTTFASKRHIKGDALLNNPEMHMFSEELERMSEFAKIEVHVGVIAGLKEKETLATASGDVNPQPFESDLNPVVFAPIRPMTPVKDGSSHGMSSGRRSSVFSTPQPLTPNAKFLNMSSGSSDRLSDRRCLTPKRLNKTAHTPKSAGTTSQENHELEGLKALLHGYGLPTNAKDLERHLSCHDLITNIDKTPSHAVDQSQPDTDLPG